MRKSLVLALTALGGSASYAAGVTPIGPDPAPVDPATWRWHVSSILATQDSADRPGAFANFEQRYARYSHLGQLRRGP